MSPLKSGIQFVDAQEMGRTYPESFYTLTEDELARIGPGDFVKVCLEDNSRSGERFWVIVHSVVRDTVRGEINNRLLGAELFGVDLGDIIQFEKRNIYDYLPKEGFTGPKGASEYTLTKRKESKDWRQS